jgi:hypothetical protein
MKLFPLLFPCLLALSVGFTACTTEKSDPVPVVIPAPSVKHISPIGAPIGSTITLIGTNLTQATTITFTGAVAAHVTVINDTTVTAMVPAGALTGSLTITTASGTSTGVNFWVISNRTSLLINKNWKMTTALSGRPIVSNGIYSDVFELFSSSYGPCQTHVVYSFKLLDKYTTYRSSHTCVTYDPWAPRGRWWFDDMDSKLNIFFYDAAGGQGGAVCDVLMLTNDTLKLRYKEFFSSNNAGLFSITATYARQ